LRQSIYIVKPDKNLLNSKGHPLADGLQILNLARPERLRRASCPPPFGFAAQAQSHSKFAPGEFVELLSLEFSGLDFRATTHLDG